MLPAFSGPFHVFRDGGAPEGMGHAGSKSPAGSLIADPNSVRYDEIRDDPLRLERADALGRTVRLTALA